MTKASLQQQIGVNNLSEKIGLIFNLKKNLKKEVHVLICKLNECLIVIGVTFKISYNLAFPFERYRLFSVLFRHCSGILQYKNATCTSIFFILVLLGEVHGEEIMQHFSIACLTVPKLSYLGEHSEVSQARSLHACGTRMLYQTRTGNNRKLPKHKLSQNAKNLQCLLKFGLIEDNVTVFQ